MIYVYSLLLFFKGDISPTPAGTPTLPVVAPSAAPGAAPGRVALEAAEPVPSEGPHVLYITGIRYNMIIFF